MFTQKIARQVHSVRKPPRTGPIAVNPPAIPKNRARALPRWRSSKVCTTMASAAGNMIAPPSPWTARKITIQASANDPFGVSPHSAEAAANTITPSVTILRWPIVSASRPPNAKNALSDSR
jgi:hypothetical protein